MKKLAIISTHPIQYNAPLFRLLAQRNKIQLKVFYTWSQAQEGNIFDPGFGMTRKWDIPLLEGYDYSFINNTSAEPGSHHFSGIKNPSLIEAVKEFQADALLVFGWSFHAHLQAMRHFKGKITIYFRGDSTLLDEAKGPNLKKIIRRLLLTWVYSHTDYAFYAGQNNKNYFLQHRVKEEGLIFMPHAIDNTRFSAFAREDGNELRKALNISPDAICAVFAGKLEEKKDPLFLLQNFLALGIPGTFLIIVGNGPMEARLKELAKDHQQVRFMPFQNQAEMPRIYQMADLFILPSKGPGETWGLSVNEAMASARAVLVSDKCGCSIDLVKPGINGEIFEACDEKDLRKKLQWLLSDRQRLLQMGNGGKEIINDWSFEKCASIIENEFNT